jgi:hypothetical protein
MTKFNFGDRVQIVDYVVDDEREYFVNKTGVVTAVPDEHNCYYTVTIICDHYADECLFEENELTLIQENA